MLDSKSAYPGHDPYSVGEKLFPVIPQFGDDGSVIRLLFQEPWLSVVKAVQRLCDVSSSGVVSYHFGDVLSEPPDLPELEVAFGGVAVVISLAKFVVYLVLKAIEKSIEIRGFELFGGGWAPPDLRTTQMMGDPVMIMEK